MTLKENDQELLSELESEYGIVPAREDNVFTLRNYYADLPPTKIAEQKPKIKVSPYAKFEKFHHKKKRK